MADWASIADHWDLLDDTAGLLRWLAAGVPDAPDSVALGRARLLLLQGKPQVGLDLLAEAGLDAPSPDPQRPTWQGLVADACRAGCGDTAAFERVRQAAASTTGTDSAWSVAYLLAACAPGVGDRVTADRAWIDLATRHGRVTALTVAEYAAAQVAGRDRLDHESACASVLRAAQGFDHAPVPLTVDPAPALHAATLLRERGDGSGAWLLLHAVRRLHPALPELEVAQAEVGPTADQTRRYRWLVAATVSVLTPALMLLNVVGLYVAALLRRLWQSRVPLPGLDRTDSRAARALSTLRFDEDVQRVVHSEGQTEIHPLDALALVLGLLGGAVAAVPAAQALQSSPALSVLVPIGVVVTAATAAFLLSRRLRRDAALRARRRREQTALRARIADASQCGCWQWTFLAGEFAAAYLERHLVPEQVEGLPLDDAGVGRCPSTGSLWLTRGHGARTLLLRAEAVRDAETGPLPVGLYL